VRAPPPVAQGGLSVEDWLQDGPRLSAHDVLLALFGACSHVSSKIATASCDSTSCFNDLGLDDMEEEMLAIDLLAEEVLFDALQRTGQVAVGSSESDNIQRALAPVPPPPEEGSEHASSPPPPLFSVALDPLDASSIIDSNFAVGTIFAIWERPSLVNVTGRQLVAAGACTYGPRTAITLALADRPGVFEFLLVGDRWLQSNVYEGMAEGKLFAPGNLRATASNERYAKLVSYWQQAKYTLRYTGGLVPDVTQLLVKGKGVFASCAEANERPKLRLLYEAIPMAFLIEKAGGASSDGERSLLDIPVREWDARTQVVLGSAAEVERFEQIVGPA